MTTSSCSNFQWTPSGERASAILEGLLTNVYRAFDVRDESRVYDRLAVSVSGGYQYADVPWMGPTAIVVTNNDPDLAEREAAGHRAGRKPHPIVCLLGYCRRHSTTNRL